MLAATTATWTQAAQGEISPVVAAFMTHAAFAVFEEIEQRLKTTCDNPNPEALRNKILQFPLKLKPRKIKQEHASSSVIKLFDALQQSLQLLVELKGDGLARQCEKTPSNNQLPSMVHLLKASGPASTDKECLTSMLQNIGQHVQTSCRCSRIVRVGTPMLAEVGYYLTHDGNDCNGLRCSYGLRLLLEAYQGYLFASRSPCAPSGCRLKALRFVQEAMPSITAVLGDSTMPCRCHDTLAYHLENLHTDLNAYLHTKGFDFYFQSPWVSGSHTLEVLEALFHYGLRLFSYRGYVGAVVHVYNALKQFTDLEPIPLLENICNTFSDIIFPAGRPCRNFKNCYVRYMGGRLRFGHRGSNHQSGCHSMAIPAHTAKATAGIALRMEVNDPRFSYWKTSFLHYIKTRDYRLDEAAWSRVSNLNSKNSCQKYNREHSCWQQGHSEDDFSSYSPQYRLQSLQDAVLTEFNGPFPVAKVNLYAIYLACVRTISLISDKSHGEDTRPGQKCLCFTDTILSAVDRCTDGDHIIQLLGYQDLAKICQDAMIEVLGRITVEEVLWQGI